MKHASTRELFAYWDRCRGSRPAPERDEIDPGAIRRALGDIFMLTFDPAAGHPFRLAGTRICALFCRELKGSSFTEIWGKAEWPPTARLLEVLEHETVGMVASASGQTREDQAIDLELLLLPLSHRGRPAARLIGTLAPMTVPYWLGVRPIENLSIGTFRHVGPNTDVVPAPLLVPAPGGVPVISIGRMKRGLTVYDGGRGSK